MLRRACEQVELNGPAVSETHAIQGAAVVECSMLVWSAAIKCYIYRRLLIGNNLRHRMPPDAESDERRQHGTTHQ